MSGPQIYCCEGHRRVISFRSAGNSISTLRRDVRIHNSDVSVVDESYRTARRVVVIGIGISSFLACGNIAVGLLTRSTSVVATGFEFAGDVLASIIVWVGMRAAARPADEHHPYGHSLCETPCGVCRWCDPGHGRRDDLLSIVASHRGATWTTRP
ncbi:MAG: hypothetical protein GEU82_10405 [Luteitalea sp.]|nr:hypothetical protein [Luteitalea sp.]